MNYFNYFTEIEETFIRRRGKHLLLSPLDWAMIESWKERGIPLRIVVAGIENVFDAIEKNPKRSRNIKSITYCKSEIESLYEDWRGSQIGKSAGSGHSKQEETSSDGSPDLFSKSSIENHLTTVIDEFEKISAKTSNPLRRTLDKVLLQLNKHKETYSDTESLERELSVLEDMIDRDLLRFCDPEVLSDFRLDIQSSLARQKTTMENDVYQKTFNLMLIKRLRERAEIPRLSLFYL